MVLTTSPVQNCNDSACMSLYLVINEEIYKRNLLQEQCTDIIHKYITICICSSIWANSTLKSLLSLTLNIVQYTFLGYF